MYFWKVYKTDITHLNKYLPVGYKKIFTKSNETFRDRVLNDSDTYFYVTKNGADNRFLWGWMPGDEFGFDWLIKAGYTYKGDVSRMLKLENINSSL